MVNQSLFSGVVDDNIYKFSGIIKENFFKQIKKDES